MYNFGCEIWKAAGYRVYDRFLKEPKRDPKTGEAIPPPSQPSPQEKVEQMKLQADAQKTQALHGQQAQKDQFEADLRMRELDHAAQLKQLEQQGALELQQSNDQRQSALDQQKHALEMAKIESDAAVKIQIANIQAATSLATARISAGLDDESKLLNQQEQAAGYDAVEKITAMLKAPKKATKGPDGSWTLQRQEQQPTIQ